VEKLGLRIFDYNIKLLSEQLQTVYTSSEFKNFVDMIPVVEAVPHLDDDEEETDEDVDEDTYHSLREELTFIVSQLENYAKTLSDTMHDIYLFVTKQWKEHL
jgi:hypothetical protein